MAIPNKTIEMYHVGETKEEFKAGIRSEDFPHIANLLINLYGDPITAIMREYSNNALDAHIAAGNPDPIQVTMPTEANPEFVVQDYGIGLSVDDLRDIYSMYGRSTKRGNNNETGQLGLGCKSGLTYADAFTITSVKNGVKVVAQSTKDEHGVGTIYVIDTAATSEPNGVRIAIPVKERDIYVFEARANHLFQFWAEGTVLIDGETPEPAAWRDVALALDDDTLVLPTNGTHGLYSSHVIMGNVPYPIRDITIKGKGRNRDTLVRVVARINMGDVDFIPSRENIHDTPHTQACLEELTRYVNDNFDRVLDQHLAEAPSRWDAAQLKVLWKGSNVKLNASIDRPIWEYVPARYGQRKASASTSYSYQHLTDVTKTLVVTKYPSKNVPSANRTRLVDYDGRFQRYVLVPTGVDVSGLDGRANVVEWDEILEETQGEPDPVTGKRVKRDETKYDIKNGAPLTAAEIAALPGLKLLIHRNDRLEYGTFDATVVKMYSHNQESRLKRLIPGLKDYSTHVREARNAAARALTDKDRSVLASRALESPWTLLDADEVKDETLAKVIRLYKTPLSANLSKAIDLGVTIDKPADWVDIDKHLADRYPLINTRYYYYGTDKVSDVLFYVNAKTASIEAEQAAGECLDSLAS